MRLYFVRHGHTDASPNTLPDPATGEVDEPLNDAGIQQANTAAEQLSDIHFDAIIASPLKRAQQTAQIIAECHNLSVKVDPVWRERSIGAYVTMETWNDLFDFDKNVSLEGAEDLRLFFKRVYDALDNLREEYEDKTVLLVSHGGVHQAVYAYANKLPLTGNGRVSPLRNCEWRVYDI